MQMDENKLTRRLFLAGAGSVTVGSSALSSSVVAKGRGKAKGNQNTGRKAFPPKGITEQTEGQRLGNGKVSTFSSVTPSGKPKYVGIHFSAAAQEGLPTPEELEESGEGVQVHGKWSKPYRLKLPDNVPAPFEYVGFAWNPQGHPPDDVWGYPHFDLHFYLEDAATVGEIGPGTIEGLSDQRLPDGYFAAEDGAIVPNMGGHLAPKDAPEFNGGDFSNTIIWGAADVDGDGGYENHFIEPMITTEYFSDLTGVDRNPIAQPAEYSYDGWYPTSYAVRDLGNSGYAVVLESFVEV